MTENLTLNSLQSMVVLLISVALMTLRLALNQNINIRNAKTSDCYIERDFIQVWQNRDHELDYKTNHSESTVQALHLKRTFKEQYEIRIIVILMEISVSLSPRALDLHALRNQPQLSFVTKQNYLDIVHVAYNRLSLNEMAVFSKYHENQMTDKHETRGAKFHWQAGSILLKKTEPVPIVDASLSFPSINLTFTHRKFPQAFHTEEQDIKFRFRKQSLCISIQNTGISKGCDTEGNTSGIENVHPFCLLGRLQSSDSTTGEHSEQNQVHISFPQKRPSKHIRMIFLNENSINPPVSDHCRLQEHFLPFAFISSSTTLRRNWTFADITKQTDSLMKENICIGAFLGTFLAEFIYLFRKKKDKFYQKRLVIIQKRRFIQRFCSNTKLNKYPKTFLFPSFLFQWRVFPQNRYSVYPLQQKKEIDMSSYLHRLGTFKNRIKDIPIQPYKLASEGFYALKTPHFTQCFSCGFQYSSWKAEDDPRKIHFNNSPDCPYLRRYVNDNVDSQTGNSVPHTDSTSATASKSTTGTQTSGTTSDEASISKGTCKNDDEKRHDRGTANERHTIICYSVGTNQSSQLSIDEYPSRIHSEDGGITNHHNHQSLHRAANLDTRNNTAVQNGLHPSPPEMSVTETASIDGPILDRPRYPSFAVLTIRISSFQGWPGNHTQTPKELALAGFLYAGYGDYVRCYFCGGGLRNWEPGDDPWVEHARWFPRCGFLRQSKGEDFIQLVRDSVNQETLQENNEDGDSMNSTFEDAKQSVAEMGYPTRKIEEAVQKLMHDDKTVTAASILDLLLDENETSYNSIESEDHTYSTSESGAMAQSNASSENSLSVLYHRGEHPHRQTANSQTNSEARSTETSVSSRLDSLSISSSSGLKSGTASAEDTTSLREENRQLRSLKQCKVCLDRDASIAFLPCGHLVCCSECAPALRRCPICRGYIKGSIKTWLA